jgi:galactan endo-1,6-beta-galactosidase
MEAQVRVPIGRSHIELNPFALRSAMLTRRCFFLRGVSLLATAVLASAAEEPVENGAVRTIAIDPAARQGTWQGWGVSLAWWAAVFGDRDDLADALFTTGTVQLGPDPLPGLGLNVVRYNAGACSWNEVEGRKMAVSKIIHRYRQMEGFWLDGTNADPGSAAWDWNADAKQRAMLAKAKERGADRFELFSNSPMWWMTRNDNPSGGPKPTDDNLAPAHEKDFAIYLAAVARRARDKWGISFTTVSPFNEPNSEWWFADCKQEGCHTSAAAQARFFPQLRRELDRQGLEDLAISASEETYYDHAIETWKSFNAATRDLIGQVNVHGYQEANGDRTGLHRLIKESGKPLWNSEYGDGEGSGLKMARNLHRDFTHLRPVSWSYWQAVDIGGWGLIRGDLRRGTMQRTNPKWHVLAQYTRHIPTGATILSSGDEFTVAAYDSARKRLTLVCINDSGEARNLRIDLSAFSPVGNKASRWITEPRGRTRYQPLDPLVPDGKMLNLELPAHSIETLVMDCGAPK